MVEMVEKINKLNRIKPKVQIRNKLKPNVTPKRAREFSTGTRTCSLG